VRGEAALCFAMTTHRGMGNVIVFEGDSVGLDNRAKQTLDEMMRFSAVS